MDASASTKPDADIVNVISFFFKLDDMNYTTPTRQKSTVIKYTKLPNFDFDAKASWHANSYILKPRLRRIISLDEDDLMSTSRSLKPNTSRPLNMMATSNSNVKRKIVTISEDDENDLHPKFAKEKKPLPVKKCNRYTEVGFENKESLNRRSPPILSNYTRSSKEIKTSARPNSAHSKNEIPLAQQNFKGRRSSSVSPEISQIKNAKEKASKEIKTSARPNSAYSRREITVAQQNFRGRRSSSVSPEISQIKNAKEKETQQSVRSIISPPGKTSLSKNLVISTESEKEIAKIKNILYNNLKSKSPAYKRPVEKPKPNKLPHLQNKFPKLTFKDISLPKPLTVIRVPLSDKCKQRDKKALIVPLVESIKHTVDSATETDNVVHYKDAVVATDLMPTSISRITEMQDFEINTITTCERTVQTDSKKTLFDSLEIPNVTLTKDKSEPKEAPTIFNTASSPNPEVPPVKIVPQDEEVNSSDKSFCQSAAYIIRRATVTYTTTRQKFNFQLVGNDDDVGASMPPSPLHYPMNVVSVFKNELKCKKTNESVSSDDSYKKKNTPREEYLNHLNDLKTLNCSYVFSKLMKPSDIISTITVNDGLLQSDYICEQFQRELNFIDSFFESLKYLETCSLTDKCHPENKVENFTNNSVLFDSTFDVKRSEYDNFLSKLENGANIDDTETMASKSLCLLNLLIRDEQRRAKNLLFVLKMREDALKDFTKSQILWLEKKKKHENTDISTLKKKQRGALLKLQHECGEMQRMRKALLALSEKRKVALMKTKKNIELKLRNNVDVDQIILGKKKLKRSTFFDRNAAPLKCFELSSSGCEESSTSKATLDAPLMQDECAAGVTSVTSAEKCVQTSDAHCVVNCSTDIAAEHFVVVDGGYLNILFHNLALPQIFSSGKQYEVNEEALRNIVHSANSHNTNLSGSEVVEKLMDQIKNKDSEIKNKDSETKNKDSETKNKDSETKNKDSETKNKDSEIKNKDNNSSSSSTARSLIEEFDQYYNDLNGEDKSRATTPELKSDEPSKVVYEIKDWNVQTAEVEHEQPEVLIGRTSSVKITSENACGMAESLSNKSETCVCEAVESEGSLDKEPVTASQAPTGPLPVPVGAAAVVDSQPPDVPTWSRPKLTPSSHSETGSVSSQDPVASIASLAAPVHVEAEELRRQQLAIEREIKALEQQQCRLLVVREIPDKPPPPYTPPTETRTPKPPRMFTPDENVEEKVEKYITDPEGSFGESTEAFSVFVRDYCLESLERHKQEQSDKPWDACNLLPQKPQAGIHELVETTSSELKDVLTTVMPAAVSGVSSRRSDHIDDILFAEWRRCEPEWTALHTDEALVKTQIFESIFQKILTDTIDEYKKTVQYKVVATE